MVNDPLTPLHRQVARVGRRLWLQTLANQLIWCWTVGLAVAVGWFLLQPFLIDRPPAWLRWAVAGGALALATVLAGLFAWLRRPSAVVAALSLDERFGLKERVTTSFTLTPEQRTSPAGQALLQDVTERVAKLDVTSRYPLHMSWTASLVPACAIALTLVALFYQPPRGPAGAKADEGPMPVAAADKQDIDKKVDLLKKPAAVQAKDDKKSAELEKIEEELDKIASRPRDNQEQLRERIKELAPLEDQLAKREKQLADRSQSMKQQLQQLDRLTKQNSQEGPAKDLQNALSQGNFDKAQEEIERLSKKLKDNELSAKDKEQLARQLDNFKDKIDELNRLQKAKEEELQQLIKEAKDSGRDAEALERELQKMQQQGDKLKDLQDLAKQMEACKQCLQNGDADGAAGQLQGAGEKLKKLGATDKELQDIQDRLQRMRDARESMCKGCKGDKPGDGPGGEGIGSGRRPDGQDQPYRSYDDKAKADFDHKGQIRVEGYVPGQAYKKPTKLEIEGEIRQASQEAPEAIERQRIPKAARDMARDYFRGLGGQPDK